MEPIKYSSVKIYSPNGLIEHKAGKNVLVEPPIETEIFEFIDGRTNERALEIRINGIPHCFIYGMPYIGYL